MVLDSLGLAIDNLPMLESRAVVVHVIGADTPLARLEQLAVLRARLGQVVPQRVVHYGRWLEGPVLPSPDALVTPRPGLGWFVRPRAIPGLDGFGRVIFHVWSPAAMSWALMFAETMEGGAGPALVAVAADVDLSSSPARLARWYAACEGRNPPRFVCPSGLARRRLIECGVPAEECVVIRDSVDFGALQRARETARRSRFGLGSDDRVLLALPPAEPGMGGYLAAWSAMLLDKLIERVRLLISRHGREAGRLSRLVEACRHGHVARFAPADTPLPELLALCDLVVFLPESDAPATNLSWAMASGRPIVASAVPAVSEFLAHGHNAWLARPGDPKDTTRRLVQALERPADSATQANLARSQAFKVFSRQRMVEQYHKLYENLAVGRPLAEGIVDAAVASP